MGVAYDSANEEIYISDAEYDVATVIYGSNNTVLTRDLTVPGAWLEADTFDSANGYLYFTSADSNRVAVIAGSNNTQLSTIDVGGGQFGIAYDNANGDMYVSEASQVTVFSASTGSVVTNIPGPGGGSDHTDAVSAVVYDPANQQVYVSDSGSSQVTVIAASSNTILSNLTVGSAPCGMAYDSSNGYLYVSNYGSSNLSVIDTSDDVVIGSIPVAPSPVGLPTTPTTASCM